MAYSILIVDDDSAIKESVEEYLNILKYDVKSALSADEALKDLAEKGEEWAKILMLKRSKEHPDRYDTEWGDKTALGIYYTICRLVLEVQNED